MKYLGKKYYTECAYKVKLYMHTGLSTKMKVNIVHEQIQIYAFKRSLNTGQKEERYIQDIFIVDVKDKLGH